MSKNKRATRARTRREKHRKQQITFGVLGVIIVAVAALFLWPKPAPPPVAQARLDDNPSLGAADAPVTLTELGDFTCSACRSWHQAGVLNQILSRYDGLLRVEWRDFPIITTDSPKAAQAGQCAHDQGQFWAYLDRVYREPGSSYSNGSPDKLRFYAQDVVDLDVEQFNACLDSNEHQMTVQYDLDFARGLGLRGTPSFLVNGAPVIGANPELLIQTIEAALASIN
jgi:protein-disulfide isomerase